MCFEFAHRQTVRSLQKCISWPIFLSAAPCAGMGVLSDASGRGGQHARQSQMRAGGLYRGRPWRCRANGAIHATAALGPILVPEGSPQGIPWAVLGLFQGLQGPRRHLIWRSEGQNEGWTTCIRTLIVTQCLFAFAGHLASRLAASPGSLGSSYRCL